MAVSETARLIASLELKDQFTPGVNKALGGLGKLDAGISRTQSRANLAGQQVGTGIKRTAALAAGAIGFLAANVAVGLKSLQELEVVTTQTNAVLKSTNGVAGQTAESIRNLAQKYEALNATIDDKVIQSAENVLLTFTAVRKDAFEPAIAAALDMSTALGTDLQGSVIQIGKALQDPIKGITALRRAGVNFSADQIKVIKALVDTGKSAEAQKIILAELNKEFGGSFLAGGNTTAGKIAKFKDAIDDLQKTLATALLPVIGKVADGLSKFLADPAVIKGANDLGQSIAGLFSDSNLKAGADFLKGAFETAKSAAPVVAAAAKTTFGFVQAAVTLFRSLPKELQALAIGGFAVNKLTGGLVTNIAGGIIDVVGKGLLQRGGTPANPLFVSDVTKGIAGLAGAAASGAGGLGLVAGSAALAAGTAVSALGIMGLGWLINATSSQEQIATTSANIVSENLRKRNPNGQFGPTSTRSLGGESLVGHFDTSKASSGSSTRLKDDIVNLGQLLKGATAQMADEFRQAVEGLKKATKPADVAKAVKAALATVVDKGRGSVDSTKSVLAALKSQLSKTHDPKTAAILRAAIGKVQAKIPGREFAQRQIAKADAILKDGKITNREVRDLQAIEKALKDRGLPAAANKIAARVDAAKTKIAAASKAAGQQAAFAIRDKELSTKVTIPITNRISISNRDIVRTQTTFKTISGRTLS